MTANLPIMTANLPIDIARQSGANFAHAVRRIFDWTTLPWSDSFWLEISLAGPPEELPTLHSPFSSKPAVNLLEVLETFEAAAEDPQVAGVLIRVTGPLRGMSRLLSLRRSIAALRARGKKVVVYAETLEIEGLLVASAANAIWMPESGSVFVVGLRLESFYMRGVLDRFDIAPEVVSVGKYKSAGESFTREGMSPESREQLEALADDLYHELVEGIAAGRNLTLEEVRGIVDAGPYRAPAALEAGLLDRCLYPDEFDAALAAIETGAGASARGTRSSDSDSVPRIEASVYYALRAADPGWRPLIGGLPRIAYVVARGTISRGASQRGISSETYGGLLEALRVDERIAGVVLRIDSGGGDALASDLLWRAVTVVRRDKPVVVSMGDVVASGGYFVAAAADEIFAEAGSVTGSIGVVGGKINLEGLYRRVGLAKDAVERGARAGMLSEGRSFTPDEKHAVRTEMTAVYENFVSRVAAGRKSTVEEIHAVAQGRIWSGERARQVGLVDKIGGPLEAIEAVRGRAGLVEDQPILVDRYPRRPRIPGVRDVLRVLPLR